MRVGIKKDAAQDRTLTAGGSVLQVTRLDTTARDPSSHLLGGRWKVTR